MSDLASLSKILGRCCILIIIGLPALTVLAWLDFDTFGPDMAQNLGIGCKTPLPADLLPVQTALGIGVMMVPTAAFVFGVWHLRRLFMGFSAGQDFTAENIKALRVFAWSVAAAIVLSILTGAVLSVVLTMNNPPGQRVLAVGVSSTQVLVMFLGAVFAVIAHMMEAGRAIAIENAEIL